MSRRTYKDFSKPASEQEQPTRRKKRGGLRMFVRFLVLCVVLLCLYTVVLNWRSLAPDSIVAWADDLVDGTTGGSWPISMTGDTVFDMQEAGANLVMVTDTAVKYYNAMGGESVRRTCAYASPILRVTDKYVLLLEANGSRYRLETRAQAEEERTVLGTLLTGAVSAKGDVAVVTDSSQSHVSEVTVYSRAGNERYQWLSAEWLVMDVAFSRDGNSMAIVGCRAQNGGMQSTIMVFDLRGKEEQPKQYMSDGVLFSRVQYTRSGTVVAIGDKQMRFVNPTGSLDTIVDYDDVELIGFAFGKNDVMLVTRPYGMQDGGTAYNYSSSGDLYLSQEFEGEFRDVAMMDKHFLLLSDEYVYQIDTKGIVDRAPVSADSLMTGAVEGKALVLGLTELGQASWETDTTTTIHVTTVTNAPETTTAASTTATTTTTVAESQTEPTEEDVSVEDETGEDDTPSEDEEEIGEEDSYE